MTYIEIPGHGWWYAVTVIDYYSRFLLACHLTDSFSAAEVKRGLDAACAEAEHIHGPLAKPPTLVTDNGVSFTAQAFGRHLRELGIQHVRIRYRTPQQLGLLERFHAVLKQEEVYWNLYDNPADCRAKLAIFRDRYNTLRPHWALNPVNGGDVVTPEAVYRGHITTTIPRWQTWARDAKTRLDAKLAAIAPQAERRMKMLESCSEIAVRRHPLPVPPGHRPHRARRQGYPPLRSGAHASLTPARAATDALHDQQGIDCRSHPPVSAPPQQWPKCFRLISGQYTSHHSLTAGRSWIAPGIVATGMGAAAPARTA